jgi:glycosyltransferase involved in cell wall biosynthesis
MVGGFGGDFLLRQRLGLPDTATEVLLDLSALPSDDQRDWLRFVSFACETLGVAPVIGRFTGTPPESRRNFAYLTDSAALSRKLLLNVAQIYIQPRAAPTQVDAYLYDKWLATKGASLSLQPASHTVTLISSVFQGDEYLHGFLQNAAMLQGYAECEHLLIRAASPGDEHARLVQHVREHPGAVYLNLAEDPGLYPVWNLGVRLSTACYVSNFNLDDRRAPEHLAQLQGVLNSMPEVDVASTALRISTQRNLAWADSSDCPVWFADVGDQVYAANGLFQHGPDGLASRNLPHCMPLWRRRLHARVGEFDEQRYGPSADWALWLLAGCSGALFHFSSSPLGLYLRDEGSYWRKDRANRRFDERIVADFADVAVANGPLSVRRPTRPRSLEISAALSLLRAGACFEGMARLLSAATPGPHRPYSETAQVLLDQVALQFLGCGDLLSIVTRHAHAECGGRDFDGVTFSALVDIVHQFDPTRLGQHVTRARRNVELACVDLQECRGEPKGLLLLALLARRHGEFAAEQALLQQAHDADARTFWSAVQSVYRFIRPLHELCGALSAIAPEHVLHQPAASHHVLFYPDYTKGNAYQDLLYRSLREAGGQVRGTSDEDELLSVAPRPGVRNVLHIHWVNRLFQPVHGKSRESLTQPGTETFLAGLARQKRRGFVLYWTIHNQISHESSDPTAEMAFRRALYGLAERVFVHHPLVASLLDWLPDQHKLCLCEHGNYDVAVASRVPRRAARQAMGLPQDDFVVTHVGQIRDYKGLAEYLPVLFDQLAALPRMRLVIAGRVDSPSVKRWLQDHRHPRITVRDGFLSEEELTSHMRAADLGILSYSAILTSGTLFHWLSCGRPVLAPACGTIPAYVIDDWNGFAYHDQESLKRLLAHCEALPEEELARLGCNAQSTAKQLEWGMWNVGGSLEESA